MDNYSRTHSLASPSPFWPRSDTGGVGGSQDRSYRSACEMPCRPTKQRILESYRIPDPLPGDDEIRTYHQRLGTQQGPVPIFCYGGNARASWLARSIGWELGSRSDATIYHRPLALVDVHWKKYTWDDHVACLSRERPWIGALPDLESPTQIGLAITRGIEIASYCASLMIIPKCESVYDLPRAISKTPVVLGYSVPSGYGGTSLMLHDFSGWPVHLLGGSPRSQFQLAQYLSVKSFDCNVITLAASYGKVYTRHGICRHIDRPLYECIEISLQNILEMWRRG